VEPRKEEEEEEEESLRGAFYIREGQKDQPL
jgi:hypothetical protein